MIDFYNYSFDFELPLECRIPQLDCEELLLASDPLYPFVRSRFEPDSAGRKNCRKLGKMLIQPARGCDLCMGQVSVFPVIRKECILNHSLHQSLQGYLLVFTLAADF